MIDTTELNQRVEFIQRKLDELRGFL